ncbi:uncharacterized protein [Amphiura filiformis]|uniref:uncharacterized protein n=1 Tax=Amphiura filiformis TaxID=82378 RepID=UPI003B2113C5
MGSPVSPIIANLFMENFEEKAITSFHTPPRYFGRYVDDTMVIIERSQVDSFTHHLNSIHDSIKFTVEHESNNSIAMLDTLISRNADGSLSFSVYRKITHRPISELCESPATRTKVRGYTNFDTLRQNPIL